MINLHTLDPVISLAGQSYRLAAGGYRRLDRARALPADTEPVVYRQRAWRRRQLETADGESIWLSEGFLPSPDHGALQVAPAVTWDSQLSGSATEYGGGISHAGTMYLAADATLYRIVPVTVGPPESIGQYVGLAAIKNEPATITDLAVHGNRLYVGCGASGYDRLEPAGFVFVPQPADRLASYAGLLLRAAGERLFWTLDETTWTALPFYERAHAFASWGDALLIGTERGLWKLTGRLTTREPRVSPPVYDWFDWDLQPVFPVASTYGAPSFRGMTVYGGWLYYWSAGWLWRWRGGRESERLPITGLGAGMALVGGYLAVGLWTSASGSVLWLTDGEGWWSLVQGNEPIVWPWSTGGTVRGAELVAWASGRRALARWDFRGEQRALTPGHPAPSVQLPAIDGGQPEQLKQFLEAGLELGAVVDGSAPASSPANWQLDYSLDRGVTWTTAGSVRSTEQQTSLTVPLALSARRLWLRVRCHGGGPGEPSLRSIWVRWQPEPVGAAVQRRWELLVQVSDGAVQPDGTRDDRSGQQVAMALVALVSAGPLPFRDLGAETATAVRVVEVERLTPKGIEPSSGAALVRLVLAAEQ